MTSDDRSTIRIWLSGMLRIAMFATLATVGIGSTSTFAQQTSVVQGNFVGTLGPLQLKLHVDVAPDGTLGGTLDSPDQGAYSAQSERGFHAIVNARCVSGPRTPIWDQVFTMTSVTDGFQLCRARIRSRRGMSVSRASLPAEPGVITQITPKPCCMGCRSGTAGGIRPAGGGPHWWNIPKRSFGKPAYGTNLRTVRS
jgi:hypothetical protein